MDFNNLYLFVGPPMTRGPPPVPLTSIPLLPLSMLAPTPPAPSLPPALPRPPSSRIKKQRQQLKPYHRLKAGQRTLLKHPQECWNRVPTHTEAQPRFQPQLPLPPVVVRTMSPEVGLPVDQGSSLGGGSESAAEYGHRYGNAQVKHQENNIEGTIDLSKNFEPSLRMKMSELDHAYSVPMDTHAPGDPQSVWTTVLDMCPQFLVLDPVAHGYY
ncbi:hypothetical protein ON010_g4383 [Phytophthora cinnamomi]|nr:hypothetical protein ON010_g4383 [Phytophthora cinnamomi]